MIKVIQNKVDQDLVDLCSYLLEKAKSGEMISIAVAFQSTGAQTASQFICSDDRSDFAQLVFAISCLKHRILNKAASLEDCD